MADLQQQVTAIIRLFADVRWDDVSGARHAERVSAATRRIRTLLDLAAPKPPAQVPVALATACDRFAMEPVPDGRVEVGSLDGLLLGVTAAIDEVRQFGKDARIDISGLDGAKGAEQAIALTGVCAAIWAQKAATIPNGETYAGHKALVEIEWTVSRINKWQRPMVSGYVDAVIATRAQGQLRDARGVVGTLMREHGLQRLVSAAVFGGSVTGGSGLAIESASELATRPNIVRLKEVQASQAAALLNIESKHWGAEGEHLLDASIRGIVGWKPVQAPVLVSGLAVDSTTTTTSITTPEGARVNTDTIVTTSTPLAPVLATVLQRAFVFGAGGRVGWFNKRDMEGSIVIQGIASHLTDDKVLLESANAETLVARVANDTRRTQWAMELGAEWRVFDTPIRIAHAEGGMANPAILMAAGFRYDSRLRATGALEPLDLIHPERRWYARFMFDPLKYIDGREIGKPAKTFDLGFGVEVEWPWSRRGALSLPTSTRWVIRGDINLLRAVAGDSDKKKE